MLLIRRVRGMSMAPHLPPGVLVVAHRFVRRLEKRDIVIIEHNGVEKIKRLEKIAGDQVFVIGDNPDASTDSRHFGWLPRSAIRAKVFWPR